MTNLIENPVYEPGIFQLETDTPVQGGPVGFNLGVPTTGFDNAQAQQLANRTAYLNDGLTKSSFLIDGNIDGIVASLPAPVNGEAYFNTTDNRIYYVVNGTFSSTPTPRWFEVTLRSSGAVYQFNGTALVVKPANPADTAYTDALRNDLVEDTNPLLGAGLSGFRDSTVYSALNGDTPVGSDVEQVDQISLSLQSGPVIARPLNTSARISLFVDPLSGSDSNSGTTAGSPLQTINAAIQKVPSAVYHRTRIYLLDGDYTGQEIKLFNYFVSARSSAGLKFIGHVASVDGEAHPVYNDDNPAAVILTGEHVISGVRGTEELTFAGVKFLNSWVESYDSYVLLDRCLFDTGYNIPSVFEPKICLSGHFGHFKAVNCTFSNCNAVIDAEGHMMALFENCTAVNIILGTEPGSIIGYPVQARNGSEVYIKNSPTFNQTWPGGRNQSVNGSIIYDRRYSDVGSVNYISRMNAAADEALFLQGGNGVTLGGERGAGAGYYGRNHATLPGYNIQEFGTPTSARYIVRFKGVGISRDILTVFPLGDIKIMSSMVFSTNADTAANLLADGTSMIYNLANGDVYIQSKVAGVRKAAKIFDFATAVVQ